jgi:ABC-2 type transport system permease protein
LSLASIGLLFALAFVLSRRSYILTSILEYPIYVLSGAVVPITMLPEWSQPISMVLAPAWGVEALRASAIPGYETVFGFGMVGNAVVCVVLMIVYAVLAWFLMRKIVKNVIETGSFTRY